MTTKKVTKKQVKAVKPKAKKPAIKRLKPGRPALGRVGKFIRMRPATYDCMHAEMERINKLRVAKGQTAWSTLGDMLDEQYDL